MKLLSIVLFTLCSLSNHNSCKKNTDCKGTAKQDCICIEIYKPVCGCDGKTYGNDCVARCAGIKNWKEGKCP